MKCFNLNLIFSFSHFLSHGVPHTLKTIFIRGYEIKNHVEAPLKAKSTSETITGVIFFRKQFEDGFVTDLNM